MVEAGHCDTIDIIVHEPIEARSHLVGQNLPMICVKRDLEKNRGQV